MKALFNLKSAMNKGSGLALIALIATAQLIYPHWVVAAELQTSGQSAVVFEIKNFQNQNSLSLQQITAQDPLAEKLDQFLTDKDSPLAGHAAEIITYANWKRALGISVVESNICRFTPKYALKGKTMESYNCSGIGGNNYKRYDSYMGWFADMNDLLSKPNYSSRPIEKFIGYYVVPGSLSWLNGVRKTERDLAALEDQAQTERLAMQFNGQLAYSGTQTDTELK